MNLDEAVKEFENFLKDLVSTYQPIGKPLYSPEYFKEFTRIGTDWDTKVQAEINRLKKELVEDQRRQFDQKISTIHNEYNYRFQALVNKAVPIEIKDI